MKLLWMILPVFWVCSTGENVTTVIVELGQNVTLRCSADSGNIFWFVESHGLRWCILQASVHLPDSQFHVFPHGSKYEATTENFLSIKNVTAEDCRRYFCATTKNGSMYYTDAFLLVPDVPINRTTKDPPPVCGERQSVIFSSFALNSVLLLVVIGLVLTLVCVRKRKNCNSQVTEPSPPTYENPETPEAQQYEEIDLTFTRTVTPPAPPSECFYSKAQLPQPSRFPRGT